MAFTWSTKPHGTLKAKSAADTTIFSVAGVNKDVSSPVEAVTQLNKILTIGSLSAVADANTKLNLTKEAVDNE